MSTDLQHATPVPIPIAKLQARNRHELCRRRYGSTYTTAWSPCFARYISNMHVLRLRVVRRPTSIGKAERTLKCGLAQHIRVSPDAGDRPS